MRTCNPATGAVGTEEPEGAEPIAAVDFSDALQEIGDDEAVAVANHEALSQEAQEVHEEALAMQEKEEEEAEAARPLPRTRPSWMRTRRATSKLRELCGELRRAW